MSDRIKQIIGQIFELPPGQDNPLVSELCDRIFNGQGNEVLDVCLMYIRSERPQFIIGAVELLHLCVLGSGPEFARVLANDKYCDAIVKAAQEAFDPNVRAVAVGRMIKWAEVYGLAGFHNAVQKMKDTQALRDVVETQANINRQSSFRRHADPNRATPPAQMVPTYNPQLDRTQPMANSSSNRPGGRPPQANSSVSNPPRAQRQVLSNLEAFLMEAQGDLASLEFALEHPDMLDNNSVKECRKHLHKARMLLEQQPDMSNEFKTPITSLESQLLEVLNLHAAVFGGEPEAGETVAQHKRTESMAASIRMQNSEAINHDAIAAAATAEAIRVEKEAIEKLIEAERKEANELRSQLEATRRSKEELQSKYKEAKDKNKQLISLVEEYGSKVDQLEAEKESNFQSAATEKVKETVTVVQKPKVSKAVLDGISQDLLQLRRGLRELKEVQLKDLGKEMSLQSIQIQGAIVNKILETGNKDRKAEQAAMIKLQELYKKEVKLRKQYYNTIQELKGNIRVYCRVRPMSDKELANGHTVAVEGISEDELRVTDERGTKTYEFDNVFSSDVSQEKVFEDTAPLIDSVVDGYNVCIFAYGQTGSGKTHTMQGGSGDSRGINRRALDRLFNIIAEREETEESSVTVSVLEIYCEQIRDLLVSKSVAAKNSYDIKIGGQYGNYVQGLKEVEVSSSADVEQVLTSASGNRSEGHTDMNAHSSRSHMVLYIIIKSKNKHTGALTYGKLSLVDLAGSERLDKSNATGQGAKEAIAINKSLSALGDVIGGLSTGSKHIPFRNSQLTFLLQDSMSGQAKVLMFCCVSPASYNVSESTSSLLFASRARGVSLGPVKKNQT